MQPPRLHVILPLLFEPLEACGVFVHRSDICLKDDWLSRGWTDHLREPPEMGRAPVGPAGGADIVSQPEGVETELGILKIAEGIFARPREIANGFIFDFGDIDEGEIPRAGQSGSLYGVSAIRFDASTGLFGNE